jgi:hypothetical protein
MDYVQILYFINIKLILIYNVRLIFYLPSLYQILNIIWNGTISKDKNSRLLSMKW